MWASKGPANRSESNEVAARYPTATTVRASQGANKMRSMSYAALNLSCPHGSIIRAHRLQWCAAILQFPLGRLPGSPPVDDGHERIRNYNVERSACTKTNS
ncbi:uncharacterized protein LOC118511666 [Anopheles stephensi]|uniref:uncharacterized protein LOC118511666 n=1 Tax=Anopheles stephensi TaxID=30069 RepID=UPI0016587689|nr:uncharacterized protein LOC118511666 [Anopheles stephensi]